MSKRVVVAICTIAIAHGVITQGHAAERTLSRLRKSYSRFSDRLSERVIRSQGLWGSLPVLVSVGTASGIAASHIAPQHAIQVAAVSAYLAQNIWLAVFQRIGARHRQMIAPWKQLKDDEIVVQSLQSMERQLENSRIDEGDKQKLRGRIARFSEEFTSTSPWQIARHHAVKLLVGVASSVAVSGVIDAAEMAAFAGGLCGHGVDLFMDDSFHPGSGIVKNRRLSREYMSLDCALRSAAPIASNADADDCFDDD